MLGGTFDGLSQSGGGTCKVLGMSPMGLLRVFFNAYLSLFSPIPATPLATSPNLGVVHWGDDYGFATKSPVREKKKCVLDLREFSS